MTPASQILPIDRLQPGMVLAEPIRDRHGNLMLAEGTALTEAHLAALDQRGIASAMVHPERIPPSAEELAELRQAAEDRLRHIFRKTLDLPGNYRLFETILAHRLENLK